MKSESGCVTHQFLTCSLSSMFESSYDLYVVVDFISCSFPYRRSSNLLALNFILFVAAICTAYVNNFVASVCPLHLLFLEGFKYHRQRMTLLSPLFRNLYQIYVLRIGGALTLTLWVRHFLLELHLMSFH